MTTTLYLSEGTWGGKWARDTSVDGFRVFLRMQGFRCSIVEWTNNVDGEPDLLAAKGNRDWIAGGYAERYRFRHEPFEDLNALTHSHGIGPVLYQATLEDIDEPIVPIRNVLAICPPPRKEFLAMAQQALERGTIAALRVIYADGWDPWARLGQLGDGHFGWRRDWSAVTHPHFSQRGEKHVGHSGMFTPENRSRLVDRGDLAFLQTAQSEALEHA
jgi:hypothetical protein